MNEIIISNMNNILILNLRLMLATRKKQTSDRPSGHAFFEPHTFITIILYLSLTNDGG